MSADFSGELHFYGDYEDHQVNAGRRVVTEVEALEIWDNRPWVGIQRNRRQSPFTYLVCGRTDGGRVATLVIRPVDETPGDWTARTAWPGTP